MTTTRTQETEIAVDPKVPLVRVTREFDAAAAWVFRAHVEPDLVARWLGPARYEMRIERYDCRTGGGYRYFHACDDVEHGFYGSFHEVREAELIVQTFTWDGDPDVVALDRVTFEDIGDGRSRLTSTSLLDSFEARDAFVASGMDAGVREGYQRLDALLAE
jgi:uncharacterized protein YndB with AHSA1/START domain